MDFGASNRKRPDGSLRERTRRTSVLKIFIHEKESFLFSALLSIEDLLSSLNTTLDYNDRRVDEWVNEEEIVQPPQNNPTINAKTYTAITETESLLRSELSLIDERLCHLGMKIWKTILYSVVQRLPLKLWVTISAIQPPAGVLNCIHPFFRCELLLSDRLCVSCTR